MILFVCDFSVLVLVCCLVLLHLYDTMVDVLFNLWLCFAFVSCSSFFVFNLSWTSSCSVCSVKRKLPVHLFTI